MSSEKIPNVTVLSALKPDKGSVNNDRLYYANLDPTATKHAKYDSRRWDRFSEADEGSVEESKAGEELALQYLLQTALALNTTGTDLKGKWSERFTQASVELYGQPDPSVVRRLIADQYIQLVNLQKKEGISQDLPASILAMYEGIGEGGDFEEDSTEVKVVTDFLRREMVDRYSSVIKILTKDNLPDELNPSQLADIFNEALNELQEKDKNWDGWEAILVDGANLSRVKKNIKIGKDRVPLSKESLVGLFAHEVLVHGLRAVNGEKVSDEVRIGLPGYLLADEGLAILTEYAFTEEMPVKMIDRYIDTALALGLVDGKKSGRKELIELAVSRNVIRLGDISEDSETVQAIKISNAKKEAVQHVNRIFRGSLGNEHVAVFTKDAVYYTGFVEMADYLNQKIQEGVDPKELFDYVMSGKFNPTDDRHVEYIMERGVELK